LVRHEIVVPNTHLVFLKSLDVVYLVKNDDGTFRECVLSGVKSDQMRIIAGAADIATISDDSAVARETAAVIDQSTGLGGWQTIAVNTVNEDQERADYERAVEAMRKGEVSDDVSVEEMLVVIQC
jgi:hypothetical protein